MEIKNLIKSKNSGAILAGTLCFLTYASTLRGQFLWDDEQFVQKNMLLRSFRLLPILFTVNIDRGAGVVSNLYRPMQAVTHLIDFQIWGLNPFGHHLTNVLLASLSASFLFLLLVRLLSKKLPDASESIPSSTWVSAFFATSLFFLHPLQSTDIAYISGRGAILSLLFAVLSALTFETNLETNRQSQRVSLRILSVVFCILGVLSKESGLLIPAFVLGCNWIQKGKQESKISWLEHLPYWLVLVIYLGLRATVLNFSNFFNFYGTSNILTQHWLYRLFTYLSTLPKGLELLFFPTDIHHERHWSVHVSLLDPEVLSGALIILALLGIAAWRYFKNDRVLTAGCLWFLGATLPTSNLLILINALIYDHWFILPGLGFALIFGELIQRYLSRYQEPIELNLRALHPYLAVTLVWLECVIPLSMSTFQQNQIWNNPIRFYRYVLGFEPDSTKMQHNLAMEEANAGHIEAAKSLYYSLISSGREYPETHHDLGVLLYDQNELPEATQEFQTTLSLRPDFFHSYVYLGKIYLKQGQLDRAIEAFNKSVSIHPQPEGYLGLIDAYQQKGDQAKAYQAKKSLASLLGN